MSVMTTAVSSLSGKLAGKVVMSGIQPTGVFHIGNVLGAVQSWVQLAEESRDAAEIVYMIADLHSLTVAKPANQLNALRWEAMASLIACGLDPERCNLYFQSQVPAHSQLHWVISSVSSMGYLSRMVQWKSKSGLDPSSSVNQLSRGTTSQVGDVNLALFSYPVLQAADVLVNKANIVPVGEDQAQHLELTRHVANSFNFRYGKTFSEPQTILTPFKRVLSLRDPLKKMSKSDPDQNACLYITDTADTVRSKLKRAVTDSIQGPILHYDPITRPAVSNLILIASGLVGKDPQQFLDEQRPKDHRSLKELVTDVVIEHNQPISAEFSRLSMDRAFLETVAKKGKERALERTSKIYGEISQKVGL